MKFKSLNLQLRACLGRACGCTGGGFRTFSIPVMLFMLLTLMAVAHADYLYNTEISIPVRDGNTLAADVYYYESSGPVAKPVIFIQTPYNKDFYHFPNPSATFPQNSNYNYVVMDWRGFYNSAGAAVPGYDRGLDGYDAVEWIATQSWCSGRVGTWGTSALGLIQYQTAFHQPPHLFCCTPQNHDYLQQYEMYYYGGDYRKESSETMQTLGFINASNVTGHPDDDAYWNALQAVTDKVDQVKTPFLVVGGWLDHYPNDLLRSFSDLRTKSDPSVQAEHKMIMGPWLHGGINQTTQGVLTYPGADNLTPLIFQFWDYYLRQQANGWDAQPVMTYYQMGENQWHTATDWSSPSRTTRTFYLQPGQLLSEAAPQAGTSPVSFTYDPSNPTPSLGGSRFNLNPLVLQGPQDLSSTIETRGDVLVFSTDVLTQDLRINGSVSLELSVSSTCTDTDFCVRFCDVYPDGRSLIMAQGIRRMRFRDSYATETLMTPGTVYTATIPLQDMGLTILAGHRLRLDICSADYPYTDANLNDGGPMYQGGTGVTAVNTIYLDSTHPSRLVVQTLPNSPSPTATASPSPTAGTATPTTTVSPSPASGTTTPTATPQPFTPTATTTATAAFALTFTPTPTTTFASPINRSFYAYPNPARQQVHFFVASQEQGEIKIMIYNAAGERVALLNARTGSGESLMVTWDCSSMPPGIYFAGLIQAQKVKWTKVALTH